MSRRARHRGARLPGLFGFDNGAPTEQLDEVPDNPRLRTCPFCRAQPQEPCITRLRNGRMTLPGYHDARKQPQETT